MPTPCMELEILSKYLDGRRLVIRRDDKNITNEVLCAAKNLETVDISGLSYITNLNFLAYSPDLETLSVSQCEKITDIDVLKSTQFKKLTTLALRQLINFETD